MSSPAAVSGIADGLLARSEREIPPLLELFSPQSFTLQSQLGISHEVLWAEEAKHRSNNLAQIATSLARVRARGLPDGRSIESPGPRSDSFEQQALVLADAYVELGRANAPTNESRTDVLARVLSGLAELLGSDSRAIVVSVDIVDLPLSQDQRRALVLITSELVINAFKHAFPNGEDGRIGVGLRVKCDQVELVVEDNGVGLQSSGAGRSGARLLDGLSSVLGATLRRSPSSSGGLRVAVHFPLPQTEWNPR